MRAPFNPAHYRALIGAFRTYERPLRDLRRYVTAGGEYPYRTRLRTPTGVVQATLSSSHDMSTVHEIFAREDYRIGLDPAVVVDIGANIGISALYFLTRSPYSRVVLYEPDPRNVRRVRDNLVPFVERYELYEAAVAVHDGEAEFGREATGRYGGIGVPGDTISVRCAEINGVLERVLASHGRIDVIKIDVEGLERELVAAIQPAIVRRIPTLFYETTDPEPLHLDLFTHRYACQVNRLQLRSGIT